MRFARLAAVVLAAAACSPIAYAQDPSPSPPAAPVLDTEKDVDVNVYTWTKVAVGAPESSVRFGGGLELRGPLAFGKNRAIGVIGLRLDVDTLPDKGAGAFEDLGTWGNYAEVEAFFSKRFGYLDVGGGRVTTSAIVTGRTTFGTIGGDEAPRRALRAGGAGVCLEWFRAGGGIDHVSVVYGRDEAVGERARGQLQVKGSIAIRGPMRFVGEFGIGFGPQSIAGEQRDYMTAGLALNLADLVSK